MGTDLVVVVAAVAHPLLMHPNLGSLKLAPKMDKSKNIVPSVAIHSGALVTKPMSPPITRDLATDPQRSLAIWP